MKRARSGKAFVWLRALSVQVRRRGRRGQLKHAHNDHARIVAVACGSLGSGGRRPVGGLGWRDGGARGPARLLALQRCVQGAGAWAGCGVEDLATHCDADLSGGPGPRGVAYSTRYYS